MSETNVESNRFDDSLLQLLRCPITHSRLTRSGDWLLAEVGGLRYPIKNGIAVMLAESAQLPAGVASLEEFRQKFGV